MATILLTEEEYNAIQTLHTDALAKIANASPRAATHFSKLAKLHADFLAKEDGKRAAREKTQATRIELEKQRQARRAASLQAAQQRVQQGQQATSTSSTNQGGNTGRGSKAS
jgi:uncharacterized protein YjcR